MLDDKSSNITDIVQKIENVIIDRSTTYRRKRRYYVNQSEIWFDKECKHVKKGK